MKKTLLTAAFAALALSAAQAANMNWTTSGWAQEGLDGHSITANQGFGLDGNDYATFVLQGTLKSTTSYNWVTEVWGKHDDYDMQNYLAFGIDGSGNWGVRQNYGFTDLNITTVNTVAATTGDYLIGFSMKNVDGTTTITISVNGTDIAQVTGGLTGDTGIVTMKWADNYVEPTRAGSMVGKTEDFALSTKEIAALPEPTALALLALGVAGVALRRRVA